MTPLAIRESHDTLIGLYGVFIEGTKRKVSFVTLGCGKLGKTYSESGPHLMTL